MPKKPVTWTDKFIAKRAPKRVRLETDFAGIKAGTMMLVGTPEMFAAYLCKIPAGQTRTIERTRNELARQNDCTATCPVTTAIFLRIVAQAAIEQLSQGKAASEVVPFWRVIGPGSTIAKKLSIDDQWIALQRELEARVGATPMKPN
jgi:hypothetical protein